MANKDDFLKKLLPLLRKKEDKGEKVYATEENIKCLIHTKENKKRVWKVFYEPQRKLVLWGWDENNNPSFLVLSGIQDHDQIEHDYYGEMETDLGDTVRYNSYFIAKGRNGHFPSFGSHKNNVIKLEKEIELSYYENIDYEKFIKDINHIEFQNFKLAKSPIEVLNLSNDLKRYFIDLYNILSNQNLYMRKKHLRILMNSNPSREVYDLLLSIGSVELISGIFLEFGKIKNPLLIKEAEEILEEEINWDSESYVKGLKRCASIYLNSFTKEVKEKKRKEIHRVLPEMDLHLTRIWKKEIKEGTVIDGSRYRKYFYQGIFYDSYGYYDYNKREWVRKKVKERYKVGHYTDGVYLNTVNFKNTIQEAEVYELPEVIGKIAYYLDAPRLYYYFKGNGKGSEYKYFRRYIESIIDKYSETNPKYFMEAMKSLLTSYTNLDCLGSYKENFMFNEILMKYLYKDVNWRSGNWYEEYRFMYENRLLALEGRFEYKKEIWDNHLDDVVYIAENAKIEAVHKACYYILKDSSKLTEFIEKSSYETLIKMASIAYEPLRNVFINAIKEKVGKLQSYDSSIMLILIECENEEIKKLTIDYFKRTNGRFNSKDIVELMFKNNFKSLEEFFIEALLALDEKEYIEFVKYIVDNSKRFNDANLILSENIENVFTSSIDKLKNISEEEKSELILSLSSELFGKTSISKWTDTFIKNIIFSVSYRELKALVYKIDISGQGMLTNGTKQVISLLESIKNNTIPSNNDFVSILETGTSKMVKILLEVFSENRKELYSRNSTLIIMLESEVSPLNELAKTIFNSIAKENRIELHKMIIDSPVEKVNLFGLKKLDETYGEVVPKEFIIQMIEHTSEKVKGHISDKIEYVLEGFDDKNEKVFIHYIKTLLYLPNKLSKSKDDIYSTISKFALKSESRLKIVENILLDIGSSNIILDSERALVALAKLRKEAI